MSSDDRSRPDPDLQDDEIVRGSQRPPGGDEALMEPPATGDVEDDGLDLAESEGPRFVAKPLESDLTGLLKKTTRETEISRARRIVAFVVAGLTAGTAYWYWAYGGADSDRVSPATSSDHSPSGEEVRVTPMTEIELSVVTVPAGAEVRLDGALIGTTPLTYRELSPGEYQVSIHLDGYRSAARRVRVRPGETELLREMLVPEADIAIGPTGTAFIDSNPPSTVYLGGRRLGSTPLANQELPAGTLELEFELPGREERVRRRVVIPANDETRVYADFM